MSGIKIFGVGCSNIRLGSIIESSEFIQDGLILHLDASNQISYPGSGSSWYDLSEYINDATLYNNITFDTNHFVFDGDNDYISLGEISLDDELQLNDNFTISFWINWDGTVDNYPRIIDKSSGGNAIGGYSIFIYTLSNNTLRYSSDSNMILESTGSVPINNWVEYTLTFDGEILQLYKDGIFDTSTSFSGNPNVLRELIIGSWYNKSGREFKGKIGIVYMYNRAISESELLYNHQLYADVYK